MNKLSFLPAVLAGASVAIIANALPASAVSFSLTPNISNVTDTYTDISSQFGITLSDNGLASGQIQFTFANNGPTSSTITDIYFGRSIGDVPGQSSFTDYIGSLVSIGNSSTVKFAQTNDPNVGAKGQLQWSSTFTADADAPAPRYGVSVGESVSFIFNLAAGKSINDVYNAFSGPIDPKTGTSPLELAFHVQQLPNGKSDWYATQGVTPTDVPEPFTMLGTGAALGFSALFQRERNKRQKAQAKA